MKLIVVLTVVLALCLTPARAEPTRAPGGVEIRVEHGRVTHLRAFGYADLEQGVRMRPDSVLRVASLSKQFTAVAVLRLVQDGHLALTDSLAERLPDCPLSWRTINLRQLLSQTSGLSGSISPLLSHVHDDLTPRELVGLYAALPVASAPGAQWEYANINYWILGLVIETASGQRYADYVQQQVIAPAHLTSTRIGDWSAIVDHRVRGYAFTADGTVINARHFSTTLGYAAGGFVSTARDMARWYDALGRGRIVSLTLLQEALTPMQLTNGQNADYGLGWYLSHSHG